MQLSLLLPAREQVERTSVASRWLARGDRATDVSPGRDAALRECFELIDAPLPIAALTRSLDARDTGGSLWLRADPAFVMADAVTLRLLACGNIGLSDDEVEAYAQTLKPLFEDIGWTFDAPNSQRWYLRCPRDTQLPSFSSPDDALGDDLARHLPEGENARRWRSLLNEAQIVLTQHPISAQRMQRGLPPVNSLWFWGAGMLPDSVRSRHAKVFSDDMVVGALAKLAAVEKIGALDDAHELISSPSISSSGVERKASNENVASLLIDLAQYRDIARLESEWLAPIDTALRNRKIACLDLHFEKGERYIVKPIHHWRFWRRAKTNA